MQEDSNTTEKVFKRFWKDMKNACDCSRKKGVPLMDEELLGLSDKERIRKTHKMLAIRRKEEE